MKMKKEKKQELHCPFLETKMVITHPPSMLSEEGEPDPESFVLLQHHHHYHGLRGLG